MKKILVLALTLTFVFAFAMSAMAAQPTGTANGTNYGTTGTPTAGIGDAKAPNNYTGVTAPNANLTPNASAGTVVGEAGDQVARIHSGYTANTNACASCHATHTAVGEDLLQWTSAQETCEACHDGTLGVSTYNVVLGQIANTTAYTKAGRFYNGAVGSKSMHNFKDGTGAALDLKNAPGGLGGATTASAKLNAMWGGEFECTSCHTPHGQGSNARILNPDINGSALFYTNQAMTSVGTNTYAVQIPATGFIKDRAGVDSVALPSPSAGDWAVMLTAPYPYGITIKVGGDDKAASYVAGTPVDGTQWTTKVQNGRTEIVFGGVPSAAVTADFFAGLKVSANITNYLKSTETVTYGLGFNNFCGACHTDYNTSGLQTKGYDASGNFLGFLTGAARTQATVSKSDATLLWLDKEGKVPFYAASHAVDGQSGTYSQAYRHTVGFNASSYADRANYGLKFETFTTYKTGGVAFPVKVMSCLTCHVSHGTDEGYWAKTAGDVQVNIGQFSGSETFDTTAASGNKRGSNLKRMPNMGVCETCHRKGQGSQGHDAGLGSYSF